MTVGISPTLADKVALSTASKTVEEIAAMLARMVRGGLSHLRPWAC